MTHLINSRIFISSYICIFLILHVRHVQSSNNVYLNEWAVEIEGGHEDADFMAAQLGFKNTGQIGPLIGHYLFVHHRINNRSALPSHHHPHVRKLSSHPKVKWTEQQFARKRVKRDFLQTNSVLDIQKANSVAASDYDPKFNDELYKDQWYLHNGASEHGDMGVLAAWQKGYTGKNVVVSILDDGLERQHSDLVANYDPRASYDINSGDFDPTPRYDQTDENRHGTRCAGEVASMANNTKCAVGIAYHAKIGGVRMLDGDVSDAVEARSLSLNRDHIDIYSASWGPDDNGKVVDGPARLAWKAFIDGVNKGRHGRGSIFVWASGNGGSEDDSCNCDGYTNSIYTLSISSVSEHNRKPWYLEECSSTLATTYSSGASYTERQIVTTDLRNRCTMTHTGTSASAPLAAGICALALEANPTLTWRDMQYITLMTANPYHVRNDGDWVRNGLGRNVSLRYGYGIMDAGAMVDLAERWTTVPRQHVCTTEILDANRPINGARTVFHAMTSGCSGSPEQEIKYLEHVQARITLEYSRRGNLQIHLVSPNGTRSTLLPKRRKDFNRGSFDNWPFMSVHFWGESPVGRWTLLLENHDATSDYGTLGGWQLVFYGTATNPVNVRESRRKSAYRAVVCDAQCADPHACRRPGPEGCTKCKHFRRGEDGPCVHECEHNEFADPVTGLCIRCHSSCYSCQGPEATDCIDCQDGIFLIQALGQCTGRCPDGYYADPARGICNQCQYPCLTCTDTAQKCTSCPTSLRLTSDRCVHSCTTNDETSPSQIMSNDGQCEPCNDTCRTCFGPSDNECLSCPSSQVLHAGRCLDSCPTRHFKTKTNICLRCYRTCTSCLAEGPSDCLKCSEGYTLHQGHCINGGQCTPGLYFNLEHRSCMFCHDSCNTCDGGSEWDCTSCPASYTYNSRTRQCLRCCSDPSRCIASMPYCMSHRDVNPQLNPGQITHLHANPTQVSFKLFAVLSCVVAVLLFFFIFAILQAKSEGYLCFKKKISYQALDALYNDRIMLAEDDFTDEEDIFINDSNDKGSVQFVPHKDDKEINSR